MNTIEQACSDVKMAFLANINSVKVLMGFDDILLDFTLKAVRELVGRLREDHGIGNPKLTGEGILKHLENIKKNGSMNPSYEKIYNSCLVLLVSYFGSSIAELFRRTVQEIIQKDDKIKFSDEEIKFTIEELREMDFNVLESVGSILINKNDISFQDMQSIQRAFKKYYEIDIAKNENVNNIILAQACRHAIVHAGGKAEKRMVRQVSGAKPRSVKIQVSENEEIKFDKDELNSMIVSMTEYLDSLAKKVSEKYSSL